MQIKELLKNNKISLRTYNICMEQQWHSSEDIRNYYNEYKHFDGIKNCGKRSMEELMRISSSDFFDRLQYVGEYKGVKYYNDSKATNPVATTTALSGFDKNRG